MRSPFGRPLGVFVGEGKTGAELALCMAEALKYHPRRIQEEDRVCGRARRAPLGEVLNLGALENMQGRVQG